MLLALPDTIVGLCGGADSAQALFPAVHTSAPSTHATEPNRTRFKAMTIANGLPREELSYF
jgi:NH3-dependent NAD+ synthetase